MQKILSEYLHESPAVRGNLYRLLNHGKLSGTGKAIILPVDQGFEHGPDASFMKNSEAYDPLYHLQLAVDAGVNGYAAPLGMLEVAACHAPGIIPMILKLNSSNSLKSKENEPCQAITASVEDAIRLGAIGVGFTIYPGSDHCDSMLQEVQDIFQVAKSLGLICVIWSYPRGAAIKNDTSLDVVAYGAHIGAITGAHIIKVKIPTNNGDKYSYSGIDTVAKRVEHIRKCAFNGRRIVLFSGGTAKDESVLLSEVEAIRDGGGNGSIVGRNLFQRPRKEAIDLVSKMVQIYKDNNDK
jgi:class I fructose-bisphosphate aldolase